MLAPGTPLRLSHHRDAPVVIAGGSGVVGRHLVRLLTTAFPTQRILILGRDSVRAEAVTALHPLARFVRFDLTEDQDLSLTASALVTLLNDPDDRLLIAAVDGGVPFVDVARWTSRITTAMTRLASRQARAPVVLSSAWMGGLAPRVAVALARSLPEPLERVEIDVRYALADAGGEDSIAYMDRMALPFEVTESGRRRAVFPLTDGKTVRIAGSATRVYRLDTPEQLTLPAITGAHTVTTRLGFDSATMTRSLAALQRSGVLCALAGERWTPLRRSLLRPRGSGATASFRVMVHGATGSLAICVADDQGQAHLTALGTLLSLRYALHPQTPAGLRFPEQDPVNETLLETIDRSSHGVALRWEPDRRAA